MKKIGIDVGSLYIKVAVVDAGGVKRQFMEQHKGNALKTLDKIFQSNNICGNVYLGVTGVNASQIAYDNSFAIDEIQAQIYCVRKQFPGVKNIISIGASSISMVELDQDGNFRNYTANSLCAAGTGSFLDQQIKRLEITYEDAAHYEDIKNPPSIAARCAVFAKSDLIHRQQEGYSKAAMWSGLCRGLANALMNTLLRGRRLDGLTIVTGGVTKNKQLLRWLVREYGDLINTFDDAPFAGSIGAAYLASELIPSSLSLLSPLKAFHCKLRRASTISIENEIPIEKSVNAKDGDEKRRKPLLLQLSEWPSFSTERSYADIKGNEVRVYSFSPGEHFDGYIGIDVGSTSTKAVVTDNKGKILFDIYRRTSGDPVCAAQSLLLAIDELCRAKGKKFTVLSCSTTGSGRKLAGAVIGADVVVNEISAHAKGALFLDNSIETIFEIGGQDSKYISIKNGQIDDVNMNYVCAAGTGSFIEEQAKNLGLAIEETGDSVMGISPAATSDRCTVFMEQDVLKLLRSGFSKKEAMASCMYSVVQNYMNKVVAHRHINDKKIFFQGATARNKGLVAAFENLLGRKIIVSPYCHVLGAYGAALFSKNKFEAKKTPTTFKGFGLAAKKIEIEEKTCVLCSNKCSITHAHIEGEDTDASFGYRCGRDGNDNHKKENSNYALFRLRDKLLHQNDVKINQRSGINIGIPQILSNYTYLPLWNTFFNALGVSTITGTKSNNDTAGRGVQLSGADFCFPIKMAYGHVEKLALDNQIDYVFLPYMISSKKHGYTTNNYFCPYVQSLPSHMAESLTAGNKILSPVIDFNWDEDRITKELSKSLSKKLGKDALEIKEAFSKGWQAYLRFHEDCQAQGTKALEEISKSGEKAIVVLGRLYNTSDERISLNIPRKIAESGFKVIPVDFMPFDPSMLGSDFKNMFWTYGQLIINAAKLASENKNLHAVFLTNYSCGPDSFIIHFVREIMKNKPMLVLELDEHSADAGYMTRIEAFIDVLNSSRPASVPVIASFSSFPGLTGESSVVDRKSLDTPVKPEYDNTGTQSATRNGKTLWIPPMHPVGAQLFAASFRAHGYSAYALPPENNGIFELGRTLIPGSECLPMILTMGSFVHKLRSLNGSAHDNAFFMPTSDGPCRFGQYSSLQRILLDKLGYRDVELLSPSSFNTYGGLGDNLRKCLWDAAVISDILLKLRCKFKPYETVAGKTEEVFQSSISAMERALENRTDLKKSLSEAMERFGRISANMFRSKPLVGIVGEIFARSNQFSNGRLIEAIEENGCEAWVSPFSEWVLYSGFMQKHNTINHKAGWKAMLEAVIKNHFLHSGEKRWYTLADKLLSSRREPDIEHIVDAGSRFLPVEFAGESILTIGRAVLFKDQGVCALVNVAPFNCMHGTITASIFQKVQQQLNIPIINMFYDGKERVNERMRVFLNNMQKERVYG